MLRATVRDFADDKIAPIVAEIDRDDRFPIELWPQDGRARPSRHHGRGGIWRQRHGLSRPLRRDGGGKPRLGLGRPQLRRAVHSNLCVNQIRRNGSARRSAASICRNSISGEHVGALAMSEPGAGQLRMSCSDAACAPTDKATAISSTARNYGTPTGITPTPWWFTPRPVPTPARAGITAFLIEKGMQGFRLAQKLDKLGMRGSPTSELVFEDYCEVPAETCSARSTRGCAC